MFTVPNGGQTAFVVNGVSFNSFEFLVGVGATQALSVSRLNNDGTSTLTGNISDPNWFDPTTVGVGSNYWVRATLLAGNIPNGGDLLNTWLSLSIAREWTWQTTGTDTIRNYTGSVTVEFSTDAGGSVIVGSNVLSGNALVDNS